MNKSLKSPSKFDSSEHRLVLLWLLFLLTVTLVSPSVFASPEVEDDMASMGCGGMDCAPSDCQSSPAMPELGVYTLPAEDITTIRKLTLLLGAETLLYNAAEPLSLSCPILTVPDTPLVFEPLLVMGPAHAAHAPPVG